MAPFSRRREATGLASQNSRCKMDTYLESHNYDLPWNSRNSKSRNYSSAEPRPESNNVSSSKRFSISPAFQDDTELQERHRQAVHQPARDRSWPPAFPRTDTGGYHILPKPCNLSSRAQEITQPASLRSLSSCQALRRQYLEEYPCTWPSCSSSFPRLVDRDRHYQTVHANQGLRPHICTVKGCQARVKSWTRADKLREHNKRWHGPYQCSVQGCPRGVYNGFRSQDELEAHVSQNHRGKKVSFISTSKSSPSIVHNLKGSISQNTSPYNPAFSYTPQAKVSDTIIDRVANVNISKSSKASKTQNSHFTIKSPRFWVPGRLFKVPWSEPTGSGGTDISDTESGGPTYSKSRFSIHKKIRRFIVLCAFQSHSICLVVHTYGGKGFGKGGASYDNHTAIYAAGSDPRLVTDGTKITYHHPIAIRLDSPNDTIDPMSLVNLTKLYTVEHNVKVMGIGKVIDKDLPILQSLAKVQFPGPSPGEPAGRDQPLVSQDQDITNGSAAELTSSSLTISQVPQTSSPPGGGDSGGQTLSNSPQASYYSLNFGDGGNIVPLDPGYGHSIIGVSSRASNSYDLSQ